MSEYMLQTENLGITFGGIKAAQDVNLKIKKGEIYGLIGPNGAGKTTTFNMIAGIYKPTHGKIYLNGVDITGKPPIKINHAGVARTFQNIRLFSNMSVIDNVLVGMGQEMKCDFFSTLLRLPNHNKMEEKAREKAREILKIFDLDDERRTISANLPYGKQRKLEIARAIATNPQLLLLDEPAAGMNPQETAELVDIIVKIRDMYDLTILLIEHDMSLVTKLCENIMVLNFGTMLAEGNTQDVINNPEVIKAYLGG